MPRTKQTSLGNTATTVSRKQLHVLEYVLGWDTDAFLDGVNAIEKSVTGPGRSEGELMISAILGAIQAAVDRHERLLPGEIIDGCSDLCGDGSAAPSTGPWDFMLHAQHGDFSKNTTDSMHSLHSGKALELNRDRQHMMTALAEAKLETRVVLHELETTREALHHELALTARQNELPSEAMLVSPSSFFGSPRNSRAAQDRSPGACQSPASVNRLRLRAKTSPSAVGAQYSPLARNERSPLGKKGRQPLGAPEPAAPLAASAMVLTPNPLAVEKAKNKPGPAKGTIVSPDFVEAREQIRKEHNFGYGACGGMTARGHRFLQLVHERVAEMKNARPTP
jgi:hypothetical protein